MATNPVEIQLNGELRAVGDAWTISDLLADLKIESRYCAVERNMELVPREQHATCRLHCGDCIEVVTLVGGG